MGNAANVKIEAMDVIFGEDVAHQGRITCPAIGSNNSKYIILHGPSTSYYAWFNVNSAGVDPAPSGLTEIEVTVATGATAAQVATALQTAIDAHADFSASVSGAKVSYTLVATGYSKPAHAGDASGFEFETLVYGDTEEEAGYIEGEIEFSGLGEDLEPITAQQKGTTILGHLRKGNPEMSVSVTLKETTAAQLRRIFLSGGGVHMPAGASATELLGIGVEKQFTSTYGQAKKMRLHPARNLSSNKSEDWNFWKAYLALDSLTFSGEAALVFPAKFMIYPDESKPRPIQYMAIGDGSQSI